MKRRRCHAGLAGLSQHITRSSPQGRCPFLSAAAIKKETSRYRDDLMDWLGVQREGYQRLSGNTTAEVPVNATANATAGATAGSGTEAAGEAAEAAGAADAEAAGAADAEAAADEAAPTEAADEL